MWKGFVVFWVAIFCMSAQDRPQAGIPSNLRVPEGQKLIFQAHGVGDQIYTCKTTDGKFAWIFKAPEARLLASDGQVLGRHSAGPTWESKDGSRVAGKPLASVASPDGNAVPWLLLIAIRHDGNGSMNRVLSIQRLNTRGRKASLDGCDSLHLGAEIRIPYEADYYFYGEQE